MERLTVTRPVTVHTSTAPAPAPVVFEGYASVFGTLINSRVPTIIEPGSFKKTLQEQSGRVVLLWQRDNDVPIGRPLELFEDRIGLFLKGRLSTTPRAIEAGTLLRDGVVTEMSIGFDPIRHFMDRDVRHLTEVRLWEISLVTHAANREARISVVHAGTVEEKLAALDAAMATMRCRSADNLQLAWLDAQLQRLERRVTG